jgi:hypothetical protein
VAGRGPAPKPADRRVRSNKDGTPVTVLSFVPGEQPALPDSFPWPERTTEWWAAWGRSPYAEHIDEMGWHELMAAALLHADVWGNYNLDRLPELRLRVAKFGVTMEDRARLRIVFADANDADQAAGATGGPGPQSARQRFAGLRVLHPDQSAVDSETPATPAPAPARRRAKQKPAGTAG